MSTDGRMCHRSAPHGCLRHLFNTADRETSRLAEVVQRDIVATAVKPDNGPTGYPSSTPLTPRQWTVVAVVGAVLVVTGIALNVEVSPEGRMSVGLTPLVVLGVILFVIAVPMRWRTVARGKRHAPDLPPPPPPVEQ